MNEFKLKYYFEMYKDRAFNNHKEFRSTFIKEQGPFPYISELIVMVYNYQNKKYGDRLTHGGTKTKKGRSY